MTMSTVLRFFASPDDLNLPKPKDKDLVDLVPYYRAILDTDPVRLHYTEQNEKATKLADLRAALRFFNAIYDYEVERLQRINNRDDYKKDLYNCIKLIAALEEELSESASPSSEQLLPLETDGKPVKYLASEFGKHFAEAIVNIKNATDKINDKRLAWVWDSISLRSILAIMAEDFANTGQAKAAMGATVPPVGYVGFIVYYFRGSVSLYLLLQETFAEDGLSPADRWDRFKTLADMRKFSLLNDWVWSTGNLLTFLILIPQAGLGPVGDMLTIVLFAFDVAMALWDYVESEAKYNKDIETFNADIAALKAQQKNLDLDSSDYLDLKHQISELEHAKKDRMTAWSFKQKELILTLAYVGALLIAIMMLVASSFITGPLIPIIGALGGVLCLVFTLSYKMTKGIFAVEQVKAERATSKKRLQTALEEFKTLVQKRDATDFDSDNPVEDAEMQFLVLQYLELRQLTATDEYQQQRVRYQTVDFIRSIIFEILTPIVIFASLMYLPLAASLIIVGVFAVLALGAYLIIQGEFAPKKKELPPEFNRAVFNADCLQIQKDHDIFVLPSAAKELKLQPELGLFKPEDSKTEPGRSCGSDDVSPRVGSS